MFWSPQARRIFVGDCEFELSYEAALHLVHPEDLSGLWAATEDAIARKSPLEVEYRIIRPDGIERTVYLSTDIEFDAAGQPIKMFGIVQDVTDLKRREAKHEQTEAALHELEQRLWATIENLPGGALFVVDRDLRYLLAKGEALAIAGFKPEDFVGRTIFELLPPELAANYEPMYRQALAGEPFQVEHNAHDRTYITRGTSLRAENGQIDAALAVSYDITDRKKSEEALRESEAKYRSLFESIKDAFALIEVLYDPDDKPVDCRFLEVSPSFEVHTGLTQAQGKTLKELIPSIEPAWFEHYHQALVTNDRVHIEMLQEYLNIWFEVDVFPYGNPQDRRVTMVFRNINERKQAEADRIQLIREQAAREQESQRAESLAELDRAKTLFFTHVSHEFRTPLTLLLAPLQDALSDRAYPLASPQRERLELAHRNGLRLLKLVNTLLDFSRIEAGRMEAIYEPTDLAMFTTELASVFRSAIERAGLRLIVDCPPLPEPVYVDREMWEKIVLNLLSNAFKFTFAGEIIVRLHPANGDRVILQIRDTGTGIAPEDLPHLFERFYQVRGATARTLEGSGIGLALVHELIRLHGGTIDVSSTVGQGSCFTIAIPFGTEHLPSDRLLLIVGDRIAATRSLASTAIGKAPYVQEAKRWLPVEGGSVEFSVLSSQLEENSSTQNSKLKTQNSHILLVDDNSDMRAYLTRILSEHLKVEAVADGTGALAAVQNRVPDLILTDVMMPGLDGFELLKTLRADPRTREVPIILLSARAGVEAVVEGLEAGADDYLIKPFSAQELVSRVSTHLQMAQLRGEALHRARTDIHRRDELLSIVSHELNTPLVSILGWTRLLRASPPSPSMLAKALDTIERNATLQAKLVQDLLDISRITAGKLRLNLEPVELKSVIETAIATVAQTAQAKAIDLVWRETIAQSDSVTVMGDPDRLQQVICNLLTNAIKFTPEGGQVEVSLLTDRQRQIANEDYAEIRVIDSGIGISAEFLPFVFDRFRQAKDSNAAKGLGLGLAIVQHLVELHKGTINAKSAGIGQGATFIVRLPLFSESSVFSDDF
ncbi:response regulator [Planktothrix sp. FACHB-1375]|uniref:histidine kinase n=2 Tax=Aerosakkonema funiforme TaxID=1246630 RepID=A0A926VES4_9CYAN|nr:response regulator [Aerosakkonema funiforme FACHB-1375]